VESNRIRWCDHTAGTTTELPCRLSVVALPVESLKKLRKPNTSLFLRMMHDTCCDSQDFPFRRLAFHMNTISPESARVGLSQNSMEKSLIGMPGSKSGLEPRSRVSFVAGARKAPAPSPKRDAGDFT